MMELHVRVALLNRFTQLGRPTTLSVAAMASLRLERGSSRLPFDLRNKALGAANSPLRPTTPPPTHAFSILCGAEGHCVDFPR